MATVVGFLVISFAVWGIGDVFRGFGRSTVAKIGRTEITIEQFRSLYNERLQQYARQLGRPIGADQARALGLDRLIVGQLFSEIVLDERARALGLALSDAEVAKQITTDPSFQGPNGKFDRFRFEQIIRNAGYTEARYVAEQRKRLLRRQLAGTVSSGMSAPKALVEAANRYQNEQRSIEYVLIDRAQAGEVPAPTPEELAKYFEERKILFRAPEYRKLVIVSLIPSEQARWIEISDADLKRAYDERRARYVTPERRHVLQIDFPDAEAARAAADRVAKGATFVDIAKELGKTEKDIDLGTVAKAGMIDKSVAEAAFALKEGEVSAPVQGRFGTVLVQVVKIEPETVRTLEEVAGALKQELATARAKAEISDLYNKIEDALLEGKTLAEAAEKLKIPMRTIEAIDRSGRDAAGMPVNLPDQQRLLAAAFTTDIGVARDPLQSQDGYIWLDVAGITPSRERPLEEVKDLVEATLARAGDRDPPQCQGDGDLGQAQGRIDLRRCRRGRAPQGRERDRSQARPGAWARSRQRRSTRSSEPRRTRSARPMRRNRPSRSYSASPISWCRPSTWPPTKPSASSRRSIAVSRRTCSPNILPSSKPRSA